MPPPKSKKKKSKSSKSTLKGKSAAKEASLPRSKPLNDLRKQAEELCEEWEASSQRKALLEQINAKICSRESIFIDNALCLGLGSLEESNLTPLPGWTSSNIEDDTTDYQNLSWSSQEDTMRFKPVAKGRKRNWSLYQLLVFETAISCLRRPLSFPTHVLSIYVRSTMHRTNISRGKISHRPNSFSGSRFHQKGPRISPTKRPFYNRVERLNTYPLYGSPPLGIPLSFNNDIFALS